MSEERADTDVVKRNIFELSSETFQKESVSSHNDHLTLFIDVKQVGFQAFLLNKWKPLTTWKV